MFERIKQSLCGGLIGVLITTQAMGQTAALLPNAVQQYLNSLGQPVTGGTVGYYIPNTLTPKNTWSSTVESVLTQNPNPVLLNAGGYPQNGSGQVSGTYGDGSYRQIVTDQNGITIWDAVTASSGAGGRSPAFSEGVMVGTIIPWGSPVLPNLYLYTAGQAVSRTTYAQLLTALTSSATILCQSGVATITVPTQISDTTPIGAPVEASCFAPGTIVQSKASGLLTLSNNATGTTSTVATIFPWGDGDGSTTFNVPDLRGRAYLGRDNMNGIIAGRLNSTVFGSNPDSMAAPGGSLSTQLTLQQLPQGIQSANPPSGSIAYV